MASDKDRWPLEESQYEVTNKIGRGAFSIVNLGYNRLNSTKVAIKKIDLETISTSFDDILIEVQTMKLCLHNNVLKLYCSFLNHDQLWLVTEYMNKGSCYRFLPPK